MQININKSGQSLVELLVALGFTSILLPGLITSFVASREGKVQQNSRLVAAGYLKEAQEGLRSVRESGWDNFAKPDGTYHLVPSGSTWVLAGGDESISYSYISGAVTVFTRRILISSVQRDTDGTIVQSGGIEDPSTKKVTIRVLWSTPFSSSIESIMYMTRFLDNLAHEDTTKTDFSETGSISNGTFVQDTTPPQVSDDGEVVLSQGGLSDWCSPSISSIEADLPKSGVANAVWAIQGQVVAGTGENSSGVSFAKLDWTDPPAPANPVVTDPGIYFDGYKTNAVFTEQGYAYLGTDNGHKEIVIINLNQTTGSPPKYVEEGYFDAPPNNGNGNGIFVSGSIGFATVDSVLYTFDLSGKSGSRSRLSQFTLPATGKKVVVVNSKAYVAIDGSPQIKIVDVNMTTGALSDGGQISVSGEEGRDLYVTDTRAYLVTEASATENEFFVVDLLSGQTLGSYNTTDPVLGQMDPVGVTVVTGNKAIIVGKGGEEYQVVLMTDVSSTQVNISRCGGANIDSEVRGVSSVPAGSGRAYSFIITGDAGSELKVIEGGPGGGQYTTSGTYTSAPFDLTASSYKTAFNRFSANINQPSGTSVRVKFAVADAVLGSCSNATYVFVGPDRNNPVTSYFQSADIGNSVISGAIPYYTDVAGYANPGKCLKYQADLSTSDQTKTPYLYNMVINYSP